MQRYIKFPSVSRQTAGRARLPPEGTVGAQERRASGQSWVIGSVYAAQSRCYGCQDFITRKSCSSPSERMTRLLCSGLGSVAGTGREGPAVAPSLGSIQRSVHLFIHRETL